MNSIPAFAFAGLVALCLTALVVTGHAPVEALLTWVGGCAVPVGLKGRGE